MLQPQGKRKSPRKYTIQETIQVYTDWANHYLDKGNSKKHIQDLQRDVTDGVLLAEVIEAATNQKIPDICRKPKNSSQMLDNIRCSLSYLEALGVSVEGLNAKDVRDGNLKTILGLFYALSRYKQQQKQQLERRPEDMPRLPSPYNKSQSPSGGVVSSSGVGGVGGVGGGSSIPTPSRGLAKRPPESTTSSRSTSPAPATPPLSFIPTPRSSAADPTGSALRPRGLNSPYSTPPTETRNSMLEKLKVFHAKEKPKGASGCSNSKRTSSSSGFSSARSERSDSSTSLYGEVKTAVSSVPVQSQPLAVASDAGSSPKSLARGLRNRLKGGVGSSSKRSSPKASRKADAALSSSRPSPKPLHRPKEVEASSSAVDVQQQSPPRVPARADATRDVSNWSSGEPSHEIPPRAIPNRASGEVVPPETTPRTVSLRNNGEIGSPSRARSIAVRISGEIGSPNAQRSIPVRTSAEIGLPIPSRLSSHRISADVSNIARPSGLQSPAEVPRPVRESPVSPPKETSPGEAQKMAEDASSIPKPMAAIKGQRTVALVSPMPSVNSDSNSMSESSHSNSTGQSNSSDSSVIYRPSGSESGSEGVKNIDKSNIDDKDKDNKDDDGFSCINIQPMEPLLRGYNRSLITRVAPRAPVDMTGYLSDGEMLRTVGLAPDSCDGYISEGGASLYARRLQAHRIIDSFECDPGCLSRGLDGKVSRPGDERLPVGSPTQGSQGSQSKRLGRVGTNGTAGSRSPSGKTPEQQQMQQQMQQQHLQQHLQQQQQQPSPSHQPQVVYRVVSSRVKKSDSSQQTDNTTYRAPSQSSQWKKYTDVGRVPELHREKYSDVPRVPELHRGKSDLEAVRPSAKSRGSSHGRRLEKSADRSPGDKPREAPRKMAADNGVDKSGKGPKVRGVPQSFGYVKRASPASGGANKGETRTAQVSAVPRTKVKVSGGTQTCSELHHFKSYSLTGPTASQLSQSVRERLMLGSQSLPKPGSSEYAAWFRSPQRVRPSDGSLSDTTYSNYAELHNYYRGGDEGWRAMRTGPVGGEEGWRGSRTGIMEAESLESLSSLPAQLQHRASLTHARLMLHQRDNSPRMNRSNSIRSTKSEKMYPSMLERTEEHEPYYCLPLNASQPTSPTPSQVSQGARFNSPLSPIQQSASSYGLSRTSLPYPNCQTMNKASSKDDEVHGSSVSLVSTASSLYSTAEEKQAHEIRKLRRELMDAQEKVNTLTSQLTTNAHVVSAFEQSLANMTQRLQQLTSSAERKDCELLELRQAMEELAQQESASPTLARRHTINSGAPGEGGGELARQLSADSVSSLNSLSSACSHSSSNQSKKKKKKGWLRSSFSRAFSRSKKNKNGSVSDVEDFRGPSSDASAPSSPILNGHMPVHGLKNSQSSCALYGKEGAMDQVDELRRQLREKDLVLTDIRLEALSSAHQLESLKDTVLKMRNEMMNLKQDNDRLQRQVMSKSLSSSQTSLAQPGGERRYSMTDAGAGGCELDGQRVLVSVLLGSHGSYEKYVEDGGAECVIAAIQVGNKTSWEMLDVSIRRAVKEYVNQVDSATSLGLSSDSAWSYHIGEVARSQESTELPDLLPCGYIVGDVRIRVCLKGALQGGSVDALAFETLIPKAIVQRYVSLLSDHRRIILCGPSGTGKSYLANKLAEFLVCRDDKESSAEAVATFNVDHKSSKELRQYLANVADQCENNAADLPSVIILDNLHHAASLGEVFNGFLNAKYAKCPYIIGTMNQATCSTTNLQLHHNFRWVLCANHMEPVKGFLGRYLRRRLLEVQLVSNGRNSDLCRIMEWIPNVWQHLNKFLETHSSSDVTIGPRLFLSCPSECAGSQVWFTDLWNYSVVPYLMEAVREGLQLYGRRAQWEDPTLFICQTYPWTEHTVHGGASALLRLRPEDVGYNVQHGNGVGSSSVKSISSAQSDNEGDPLLNMLMRLQEAANYSSPQSNDSDSTSVDSHSSSQMDTSRIESTL